MKEWRCRMGRPLDLHGGRSSAAIVAKLSTNQNEKRCWIIADRTRWRWLGSLNPSRPPHRLNLDGGLRGLKCERRLKPLNRLCFAHGVVRDQQVGPRLAADLFLVARRMFTPFDRSLRFALHVRGFK